MQTTKLLSIDSGIAFNTLHDFIKEIEAIAAGKKQYNNKNITTYYNLTLKLLAPFKNQDQDIYRIISILLDYNIFRIDKNQKYFKSYSTAVTDLIYSINEAKEFPEKYLPFANYIIAILSFVQGDSIMAFLKYEDASELHVVSNVHKALDKFIQARKEKNELVDQSAMIVAGSLCYVSSFISIELKYLSNIKKLKKSKQLKHAHSILMTFFDRNKFEELHGIVRSKLNILNSANPEINHQILLFWFWIYNYNMTFVNEIRLKKKASLENIMELPLYRFILLYDFDPITHLLKSISDPDKFKTYFLVPNMTIGINIARGLMDQIKYCIMLAEKRICESLLGLDLEPIVNDFHHPQWENLFNILNNYMKLFIFKKDIHGIAFPNQEHNKISEENWEIGKKHFVFSKTVLEKMFAVKNEYEEKYKPDELNNLDKPRIIRKPKNPKPISIAHLLSDKQESSEESSEDEVIITIDEEIMDLISQERFSAAIDLANKMKLEALENNDNYTLAKAYNCLGDLWRAISNCKNIDYICKDTTLKVSYIKYKSCIATIDEIFNSPDNYTDNQISGLKEIRMFLNNQLNSKEYLEIKLLMEKLEEQKKIAEVEEQKSSINENKSGINIIHQEIVLPDYVLDILKRLDLPRHQSYIVGGVPRDYYSNNDPHDYDIVTTLPMNKVMELLTDLKGEVVGFLHPVYMIKPQHSHQKEIQIGLMKSYGFNKTELVYLANGMLVVVNRTDQVGVDVKSRGLTCDSLYYDWKNRIILDPFNAINDIKQKNLRFIFKEDEYIREMLFHNPYLIFRILRLNMRLDYKIDHTMSEYIHHFLPILKQANLSRVNNEMFKTLFEENKFNSALILFEKYHLFSTLYDLSKESEARLVNRIRQAFMLTPLKDDLNFLRTLLWCIILANKVENNEPIRTEDLNSYGIHESQGQFITKAMSTYELMIKECSYKSEDENAYDIKIARILLKSKQIENNETYTSAKCNYKKSHVFFNDKENIKLHDLTNTAFKPGHM